ncbi:MAG TPA: carboxypeptidase regulatory-like domain-containing protein [Acidobacteriota bacterium]|nr:carboxypeptidase regulatory-like domain-containing protein [Acidobacteriota bacterium]
MSRQRCLKTLFAAAWVLCFVALSCTSLFGQTTSLTGTVKDPQGGIVPGATVTAVSAAGAERSVLTNDEGRYQFLQLSPGTYTIRAEQAGFKTTTARDVRLLVDTPATLDLKLELGEISEVVTITGAAEQVLNTSDATIGNTFNENQIVNLPLESRNVVNLLSLQPGVDVQGNVTGARRDQSNLTLDGIDVNEQQTGTAFTPVLRVTPDSVQEFRVTVTNPNASQGRSSGGQVSLVTKSGTNDWHGSLYHFHRNTATTANDFFNNRVQTAGEDGRFGTEDDGLDTPVLLRNLFGGSIGGPIARDKAFFFFNYEGRKDRSQSNRINTVPLPHLGQGLVRYQNTSGETVTLTPDDILNLYPATGGVNPVALAVFADAAQRFPANDSSVGDGFNTSGFRFNDSTPLDQNTWIGKVDFNLSDNQQLFIRSNYQWDNQQFSAAENPLLPRFPGGPSPGLWSHPFGIGAGHTWTIKPTLINTFRYGLTRQAFSQQGDSGENSYRFRDVFQEFDYSRTLNRTTPTHNIINDISWIKGSHTLQFGTNIRLIDNNRATFANAFDDAVTNLGFYQGAGSVLSDPIDDLAPASERVLQNAVAAVLGRFSQYTANFTFDADGSLLPSGTPTDRNFATEEYEFYFEDAWQVTPELTLNLGLRWGVNTPVNETQGFQVQPTVPLDTIFQQRVASANMGVPFNQPVIVDTSGPFYGKDGYYPTDYNNFAPRISAAWSPNFDGGFLGALFGRNGESVFRGGFAMTYDRIGSQLAVSFDLNNTLGFSSSTTIAAETYNVTDNLAPLFTGFGQDIRSLPGIPTPTDLTFPLNTPSDRSRRIESSLDSALTTPVNYSWNFSIGREFGDGLFIEAGYIGRSARNLLATRDIMHLNNLVDPASGQSFYQAARILMDNRLADTPVEDIGAIPFFENLFPNLNFGFGGTATTNAYGLVARGRAGGFDILDWTFFQAILDTRGEIDCGLGDGRSCMFFHPQYAAFSAFSTIAESDYHALAVTVRERFGDSLNFDFNWTWSKSFDTASGLQTSGTFGAAFIVNPLNLDLSHSVSDFNTQHIVNANWLWNLPFGRGRRFGTNSNSIVNGVLGGWAFNGVFRWNSGRPIGSPFESARWATNWNLSSNVTRIRDPRPGPTKSGDNPNFFPDVQFAYNSFRDAYAGEVGDRNVFNRSSFITLDFGLHKAFRMPYNESHQVVFRWEVFNATNTQRLGAPGNTGVLVDPQEGEPPPNWFNITGIQGMPRVMQFGLKYEF